MSVELVRACGFETVSVEVEDIVSIAHAFDIIRAKQPVLLQVLETTKIVFIDSPEAGAAGAFYEHDSGTSILLINKQFFDYSEEEAGTILAHEAIHFMLDHHKLLTTNETIDFAFGLAADVVINDFLLAQGFVLPKGTISGETSLGIDSNGKSFDSVLEIVFARLGFIADYKKLIQRFPEEQTVSLL